MALNKQNFAFNFSQGLDLKTDSKQVSPGKFLSLSNSIFTKAGLLQKRNGYAALPSLPTTTSTLATTFNGNLTAIGTTLNAYSSARSTWVSKGNFYPANFSTLSLIRSNLNQTQCDSAVAGNGLVCTVYTETGGSPSPNYKYVVSDQTTGQNIVAPTQIQTSSGALPSSASRVFYNGNYFIIVFSASISGTTHLQYIAINAVVPNSVTAATDISTSHTSSATLAFDGVVANNNLYLSWNGSDSGGAVRTCFLSPTLLQSSTVVHSGHAGTLIAVTADSSGSSPVIWTAYYDSATSTGYAFALDTHLNSILANTQIITSGTVLNLTATATGSLLTFLTEIANNYAYDTSIPTHYVQSNIITVVGTVITPQVLNRSLGLASKAFLLNGVSYYIGIYSSAFQPTYFLMNGAGQVVARFAYSNGGSYLTTGLPSVSLTANVARFPYLYKDIIEAVNKSQGAPNAAGIYSQTGINLGAFTIGNVPIVTAEIGENLNLTGGFMWSYDGYQAVENNFFIWPDSVEVTTATTGGNLTAQQYFYQVTYEWSDNQGNVFRSAPSVPVSITTTGSTSLNTINVPTLRLTYKKDNPVKIVLYRWSAAQETYYQVTSITAPSLNNPVVDYITITDGQADTAILGNNILYTTGGVVEDIGPPPCIDLTLYGSRLFLIDAEDNNLLWYSKQVIENTPVEMSDLFTIYVAPTTGSQGSTGGLTCTAPMDDKLILFKQNGIYYLTGTGPDNTGANNDFSNPIFITSTVGCANKASIVFIPNGLMFQSDKGIWLLGRDLSTTYIGAPVESYNGFTVQSAVNVPGTNQVRFTLSNGVTLMYDYYFNQWGTFSGVPAISSTLYQGLHTFINSNGAVFQESPGVYLDGSNPVLMSFSTGWFNFGGLQGYERFYYFYLLGQFISPHKLVLGIAYDYSPAASQQTIISPTNYGAPWGGDSTWGSQSPYGGQTSLEQWQVHAQRQTCQSYQITLSEVFDPTYGVAAGAGFTLSGVNMVLGMKKSYRPIGRMQSAG